MKVQGAAQEDIPDEDIPSNVLSAIFLLVN